MERWSLVLLKNLRSWIWQHDASVVGFMPGELSLVYCPIYDAKFSTLPRFLQHTEFILDAICLIMSAPRVVVDWACHLCEDRFRVSSFLIYLMCLLETDVHGDNCTMGRTSSQNLLFSTPEQLSRMQLEVIELSQSCLLMTSIPQSSLDASRHRGREIA